MPASISPADPADAPALTAIAHSAKGHWGYPKEWIFAWRDDLTLDQMYIRSHVVHAIRDDDGLLGFYSLVLPDPSEHGWDLDHLWVVPEAMGRGFGRALFEHAVAQALRRGASRLRIMSDPHAEEFYQRMGARTVGRLDATIGGVERWLPEMELVLQDVSGPAQAPTTSQRSPGCP